MPIRIPCLCGLLTVLLPSLVADQAEAQTGLGGFNPRVVYYRPVAQPVFIPQPAVIPQPGVIAQPTVTAQPASSPQASFYSPPVYSIPSYQSYMPQVAAPAPVPQPHYSRSPVSSVWQPATPSQNGAYPRDLGNNYVPNTMYSAPAMSVRRVVTPWPTADGWTVQPQPQAIYSSGLPTQPTYSSAWNTWPAPR